MNKNILRIIFICFALIWVAFILLDYLNKHPRHILAFQHFKMSSFVIGTGIVYLIHVGLDYYLKKRNKQYQFVNGLWITLVFLVFSVLLYASFSGFLEIDPGSEEYTYMLGRTLRTMGGGIVIFLLSLFLGKFILDRLKLDWKGRTLLADIAAGSLVIVHLILILAVAGLYSKGILYLLAVIVLALNYKNLLPVLKQVFFNPWITNSKRFYLDLALLIIILSFACINMQSIMSPFPFGFDSRNVYLNISKLVGEQGALIAGFQPYPWSLFLSLGWVLFQTGEIPIFLSFFSGILCLIYLFKIIRIYFDLNQTLSLLTVVLFFVTPAITNQFYVELKIDFGLLFFQLFTLDILLHLISNNKIFMSEFGNLKHNKKGRNARNGNRVLNYLLLLGIISGFALSIKLTHFFILFAILVIIWSYFGSLLGFYASFTFMMSLIFFIRLDDISGLRQYHLGVESLKWLLLVVSLILLAWLFYKKRTAFVQSLKISLILSACCLVMISPWMIKNYSETKSIHPRTLMQGSAPGPELNLQKMERNYEESHIQN